MAYEGIERGQLYGSIDERNALVMQVDSIANSNGRPIFPDYRAIGILLSSRKPLSVGIFKREYAQLRSGDRIKVYALPNSPDKYVSASKYEESKPFLSIANLQFTWHFPAGIVGGLIMVTYVLVAIAKTKNKNAT